MLHFDDACIYYEPYPVCVISQVLDPGFYKALIESYPPADLFVPQPDVGRKYVLSEKCNGPAYRQFLTRCRVWSEFHELVKSAAFVDAIDAFLKRSQIDVGLRAFRQPLATRWKKLLRDVVVRGRLPRVHPGLHTRFEFSMLPSDGGCVIPHTDAPGKLITLVVSMVGDGEWDPAWGGGTDINRTRDPRRSYNALNGRVDFDGVEVLRSFDFLPNQCLLFVKTFNSLHSVRPISAPEPLRMRRTITINIEADA